MERPFPLYLNWTTKTLGDRETEEMSYGGFGEGKINDPIDLPADMESERCTEDDDSHLDEYDSHLDDDDSGQDAEDEGFNEETESVDKGEQIMQKLKVYNEARDTILLLISSATKIEKESQSFKDALQALDHSLVWKSSFTTITPDEAAIDVVSPVYNDVNDKYWENENVWKEVDAEVSLRTAEKGDNALDRDRSCIGVIRMTDLPDCNINSNDTDEDTSGEKVNKVNCFKYYY